MPDLELLRNVRQPRFEELVGSAQHSLLIVAPFITRQGAGAVTSRLSPDLARRGKIDVITCLDVLSICQGTCDPAALKSLLEGAPTQSLTHLPRLHAKVFIADDHSAIITSGNLTKGGLATNFEYGVVLNEMPLVQQVRHDLEQYANLGAKLDEEKLASFHDASDRVRAAFQKQTASIAKSFRHEFEKQVQIAEDHLIRARLAGGARHTVFAKTILYLLRRHGPLKTNELHPLVQAIHPDLCDDSIDRIIDGQHFGKKWKHAVRTAQQHLQDARQVERKEGKWTLTDAAR